MADYSTFFEKGLDNSSNEPPQFGLGYKLSIFIAQQKNNTFFIILNKLLVMVRRHVIESHRMQKTQKAKTFWVFIINMFEKTMYSRQHLD